MSSTVVADAAPVEWRDIENSNGFADYSGAVAPHADADAAYSCEPAPNEVGPPVPPWSRRRLTDALAELGPARPGIVDDRIEMASDDRAAAASSDPMLPGDRVEVAPVEFGGRHPEGAWDQTSTSPETTPTVPWVDDDRPALPRPPAPAPARVTAEPIPARPNNEPASTAAVVLPPPSRPLPPPARPQQVAAPILPLADLHPARTNPPPPEAPKLGVPHYLKSTTTTEPTWPRDHWNEALFAADHEPEPELEPRRPAPPPASAPAQTAAQWPDTIHASTPKPLSAPAIAPTPTIAPASSNEPSESGSWPTTPTELTFADLIDTDFAVDVDATPTPLEPDQLSGLEIVRALAAAGTFAPPSPAPTPAPESSSTAPLHEPLALFPGLTNIPADSELRMLVHEPMERPPMIIERAQAEHNGLSAPATAHISPAPGLAAGASLAVLTGIVLYFVLASA